MSLTRSFAFAGVSSIVMTLWSVSDNSSSSLMKYFYKSLSSRNSKDVALQQAKLVYLNNADVIRSHPYYWAGYVLIGDNAPIKKQFELLWIIGFTGAVAIIILLLLWIYFKRKREQLT
jgi:hypothetical protein